MISIILYVVALVLFALATFNVGHPKVNMVPAGLFFAVLARMLEGK